MKTEENLDKPFQRKGSKSNAHVGQSFENDARLFFGKQGLILIPHFPIPIGISAKKRHKFDLGNKDQKIIVECKSHTWTETGNIPSAKITTWDQALFFFYIAPPDYRKILFVLKDFNDKRGATLAEYYIRTKSHLIPLDVEIWEYDENNGRGLKIR